MKKRNKTSVKYEIVLTKRDTDDFDRDKVSNVLNLQPIYSEAPRVSKGKVYFKDFGTDSKNFTVIHQEQSPHPFIIHACWGYGRGGFDDFNETLLDVEKIVVSRKQEFTELCALENLSLSLSIIVSSKGREIPFLALSQDQISLFASVGLSVDMRFDFE